MLVVMNQMNLEKKTKTKTWCDGAADLRSLDKGILIDKRSINNTDKWINFKVWSKNQEIGNCVLCENIVIGVNKVETAYSTQYPT